MTAAVSISTDTLLSISPHCLSTKVDAELVLMNVRSGVYCGLNAIGSEITERMATAIRFGDLVAALCIDYDGSEDVIAAETRGLIEQMAEHGLVELRD